MFSSALDICSHYFLGATENIWLLWEASFANIRNSYHCCLLPITQMGPLAKPLSEITGTTKELGIFSHSFQCCFQQLDYIEQGLCPFSLCTFSKQDFSCQQHTIYFCEQKLWSKQLLLTQPICSFLFFSVLCGWNSVPVSSWTSTRILSSKCTLKLFLLWICAYVIQIFVIIKDWLRSVTYCTILVSGIVRF